MEINTKTIIVLFILISIMYYISTNSSIDKFEELPPAESYPNISYDPPNMPLSIDYLIENKDMKISPLYLKQLDILINNNLMIFNNITYDIYNYLNDKINMDKLLANNEDIIYELTQNISIFKMLTSPIINMNMNLPPIELISVMLDNMFTQAKNKIKESMNKLVNSSIGSNINMLIPYLQKYLKVLQNINNINNRISDIIKDKKLNELNNENIEYIIKANSSITKIFTVLLPTLNKVNGFLNDINTMF